MSMLRAHTNPLGWLRPCGAGRWCQAAAPPAGIQCCSAVALQMWRYCLQLCDKRVYMQTHDRGSPWLAVAASSPGCLLCSGWSGSAPEYEEALQEKKLDIENVLKTRDFSTYYSNQPNFLNKNLIHNTTILLISFQNMLCIQASLTTKMIYCEECWKRFKLTILQGMLTDLVWHSTGSHWHISYNVKAVVSSWLQVIDDVTGSVVANNNLVFFVV